jgi:hypothetical protein
MNTEKNKVTSRRKFFRQAGLGAAASVLAARAPEKARAAQGRSNRKSECTYKLGPREDKADPFQYDTRLPGWHTDAADFPKGTRDELFPEEAIGKDYDANAPIPFPVHFDDNERPVSDWLGHNIPDPTSDPKKAPFVSLIRDLAQAARNYNSTLYLLRQYHYAKKFSTKTVGPSNPGGPRDKQANLLPDPDPASSNFNDNAKNVEQRFFDAAKALNDLLDATSYKWQSSPQT